MHRIFVYLYTRTLWTMANLDNEKQKFTTRQVFYAVAVEVCACARVTVNGKETRQR